MSAITSRGVHRSDANAVFIVPRGHGSGFQANVRGHVLDLIEPGSYALAPTTDDLLVVSMAAALAWDAQRFLRAHELPDYVSVSADWRTTADPSTLGDINFTVTVLRRTDAVNGELLACLRNCLAARAIARTLVHIALEGVNR